MVLTAPGRACGHDIQKDNPLSDLMFTILGADVSGSALLGSAGRVLQDPKAWRVWGDAILPGGPTILGQSVLAAYA